MEKLLNAASIPNTPSAQQTLVIAGYQVAFLASTMFDNYIFGVRIFDLVSYILVLPILIGGFKASRMDSVILRLPLLAMFAVWMVLGLMNSGSFKNAFGLFIAFSVLIFLMGSAPVIRQRTLYIALTVHLTAFYLQFCVYRLTGAVIDYHRWTDIEARLESLIQRFSGFYYEPAMFALAVLVVASMLDPKSTRAKLFIAMTAVATLLTGSLLGILAAAILAQKLIFHDTLSINVAAAKTLAVAFVGAVVFVIFVIPAETITSIIHITEVRLNNISADASYHDRFGGIRLLIERPWQEVLMGDGFGTDFAPYGSAGGLFVVAQTGFIGLFALLGYSAYKLRNRGLTAALVLIFVALSAPVFTYVFFAMWAVQTFGRKVTTRRKRYREPDYVSAKAQVSRND